MTAAPISVQMDSNESRFPRAKELQRSVEADPRFSWDGFADLPADIRFKGDGEVLAELKLPEDLVQSVLTGHLYVQSLPARESGTPLMIVCIGSLDDVLDSKRWVGAEGRRDPRQVLSDLQRVRDFAANSIVEGLPVHFWGSAWRAMLLSTAHKMLTGSSLAQHRPRPAGNERKETALSVLVPGIGKEKARALIGTYGSISALCFPGKSRSEALDLLQEVEGIGPTLAERTLEAMHR